MEVRPSSTAMKPVLAGFLLLLLLTTVFAAAQQTPAGAPTQEVPLPQTPVIPMPITPAQQTPQQPTVNPPQAGPGQSPTPPDYSQEAYVIEHYHQAMRFENDGTGRDQLDAQIRIVSESGVQALGQLKVGYSALSDKLEIVYVRVRKPDGTVITAQESAIQDLTLPDAPVYTDYHEKHISVPSLRPGDVLEYRVRPHHYESARPGTVLDQRQLLREGHHPRPAVGDQRSQGTADQAEEQAGL